MSGGSGDSQREPLHPPGMVEPETGEPIISGNARRGTSNTTQGAASRQPPPATSNHSGGGGDTSRGNPGNANGNIDLSSDVLFNLTTCNICLELFRDPKSLPCLHSFCRLCLFTLTQSDTNLPFPCPTCRRLCGEPVSALPDDFKGKLLVDSLRQRERENSRNNSNNNSSSASSSRASSSQVNESQQPVLCQTHGNRRCEFFCEECLIAICVKCVSMEHSTHCYIDVFEDSHFLITELEHVIEQVKRDIERLEDNNTDIDIMMGEFNYNIEERTRKLKRYVDQTALHVRSIYGQELITKQGNISRKILEHEAFLDKTNEYLDKLRNSVKDCAVFDIYADAKMHLDGNSRETPQLLFERPNKFEFAPCIEYQITNTMTQFFGQTQTSQSQTDATIIANLLGGMQSTSTTSNSSASGSSRPHSSLGRVTTGSEDSIGASHGLMPSVPLVPPGMSPSPAGARRRRQFHISNTRRASPAVEALFSSMSMQNQNQTEHQNEVSDRNQNSSTFATSSGGAFIAYGVPSNRTILPNSSSSGNNNSVCSDISVTHPLAPFFMSINNYNETPAQRLQSRINEFFTGSPNDVLPNFSEDRDMGLIAESPASGPSASANPPNPQQEVERFFQALMMNPPNQAGETEVTSSGFITPPPSSPAQIFNFSDQVPTPGPSRLDPRIAQNDREESITDSMQPERPFSPTNNMGAEETLL